MVIKRKGQIVPKRFVRAVEKKSQHQVKFGCDVEIVGNTIHQLTEGPVIFIPFLKYCNLKKNKKTVKGFEIAECPVKFMGRCDVDIINYSRFKI